MFEPITVLDLRGFGEEDIERCGRVLRVPVPEPLEFHAVTEVDLMADVQTKIVDLYFEPFSRNTVRHGQQNRWICFARAIDLVLMLEPSWLLGQEEAIYQIERQNERLTEMLLRAIRQ
jgi:hypothetical protein